MSDWGKGAKNNNIGWGQGACDNTIGWGKSQKNDNSWSGDTDISGCSTAVLSITYSSSAFCEDASDPTPTVTDNVGAGTFSSTTGLVFISTTTGQVDLSASTTGATYLITYTDTNAATAQFSLTVNALDNASFSYSASSYSPTDADPTPTVTLAGGTFSAGSGLVFVDSGSNTGSSTGQIDLSASTVASYTITYDTASSGSSVCPNTSTQTVEITALAQVSNLYSMSFDGSNQAVSIDNSSGVLNVNNITISLWFYPTAVVGSSSLVSSPNRGSGYHTYSIQQLPSGAIKIITRQAFVNSQDTSLTPLLDKWNHIALTIDGTNNILYLNNENGTTSESYAAAGSLVYDVNPFLPVELGRRNGTTIDIVGKLDEVGFFNVALTAPEVLSIYNASAIVSGVSKTADLNALTTPPIKWYRMGD